MHELDEETEKFLTNHGEELERQGEDISTIKGRMDDLEERLDAIEKIFVEPFQQLLDKIAKENGRKEVKQRRS